MGLIDLKTNLKSLKYGNDQKGGGSSNQPYIVTPIPDGFSDTSPDFLLRNGYLNPLSSTQDVSRLTKMFLDTKSPNGLLFVTKQELLERQNVEIPGGFNRIYNPLGTLAQAGVVSTGYHLNKQGLNPFQRGYFNGGRNGYYQTTLDDSSQILGGYAINRLYALYKIKQTDSPFDNDEFKDKYEISSDPNISISYNGGPGSFLGFGKTNIRIQNPTRTVVPKEEATKAYRSLFVDNVDYLIPSGSFIINWDYNPINTGVTNKYFLKTGVVTEGLFTNNDLLNRDTSTVIPIGKPENTFVKSQDSLKTSLNYLRTGPIKPGSITWDYNIDPLIKRGVSSTYFYLVNTPYYYVRDLFDKELGKENYTLPKPSSNNNIKDSYGKTKNLPAVINPNLKLFQTASIKYGTSGSQDELSKNFNQKTPAIYEVNDDKVKGLKKNRTTTLSTLNPQYFEYNKTNNKITGSRNALPFDSTGFNLETKYGVPTTEWKTAASLSKPNKSVHYDDINKTDVLQLTRSEAGNQQEITNLQQKDLVKFYFEINNNNTLSDTQNFFLFFRAYINDLGDSYKPEWQSYKYIGRAENFYKYGGFSRDISLGFTIYAHSRDEMRPIYKKLNYLVGTTAPDYSEAGYMRGNFINLTVGDYLDNVPGIIQGIDLKPSFDAGWDIDRDVDGKPLNERLQLPRMIDVTLQFTPIHTFTPKFRSPFISNFI